VSAIAHIGVVGGGAWGTALACLARRAGRKVTLWSRDRSISAAIAHDRRNEIYLPGQSLDAGIEAATELAQLAGCDAILPVDWKEITAGAATATNYQVLPGDRIFIAENKMIALDAAINKMVAPFERIFGVSLLGAQAVQTMNRFPFGFQGQGAGF